MLKEIYSSCKCIYLSVFTGCNFDVITWLTTVLDPFIKHPLCTILLCRESRGIGRKVEIARLNPLMRVNLLLFFIRHQRN